MRDDPLRATFDTAAAAYDAVRPGYPDALIADVLELSGIGDHGRILEVGCGTGQATRPFAERGYAVVCLDISAELIAVARERLQGYPQVSFVNEAFETWVPDTEFDLLISATAFHWVDPNVRYLRAAAALHSIGSLAVFANRHVNRESGFFAEVQSLYDRYYLPARVEQAASAGPLPAGVSGFHPPVLRKYPWARDYSTEQYIQLLSTYSDHIALPDRNRNRLFTGIANLIETRYNGRITKHYESVLDLRKIV